MQGEKVYLRELAIHLNYSVAELKLVAKRSGVRIHLDRTRKSAPLLWVTPHVACKLIAYVRAVQGALEVDKGKDWHEMRAKVNAYVRRLNLRKRSGGTGSQG
jgi:hypothetical protein